MKHLKTIFCAIKALLWVFLAGVTIPAWGEASLTELPVVDPMDSVEISLLTCQPHDEVYSLYGHTAIRFRDIRKGKMIDAAFNYGVFDFKKSMFVFRFVFGLTDYELGAYPYKYFVQEYSQFGCMVTEQVLNLTSDEKQKIQDALAENLEPQNKIYRYNYFYNNCTTKARDIIEQCISGKVEYTENQDYTPSYRDMIHEMTRNNPWARFGNDILLGVKADKSTTQREQEFLPHHLMHDFDHAQIYENGQYRPLVKERRIAVPAGVQMVKTDFPLSPITCAIILLAIALIIFFIEWKKRFDFVIWDLLLMITTGTIGIILTVMIFSQHPTVSLNLQIILFNPLPWFFLWPVLKRRQTCYWLITIVLCVLFFVGAFFQSYAEGIWILALCLLLQSILHLNRVRQ